MKFVLGFVLGAASVFGVWWYTRYIELAQR